MPKFPLFVLTTAILLFPISAAPGDKPEVQKTEKAKEAETTKVEEPKTEQSTAKDTKKANGEAQESAKTTPTDEGTKPAETPKEASGGYGPTDDATAEKEEVVKAAIAKAVPAEPVQVFGWREEIRIEGVDEVFDAKLDSGALTCSIHAEEQELFERDGKKWVRFIVTDPTAETPKRSRIEAPFVRVSRVKEPGGESTERMVVRLSFQIGEKRMRSEFGLNNRSNMLAPVLIGRNAIKELGWVDAARVNLADDMIFR